VTDRVSSGLPLPEKETFFRLAATLSRCDFTGDVSLRIIARPGPQPINSICTVSPGSW
jgi:hypothetical protein